MKDMLNCEEHRILALMVNKICISVTCKSHLHEKISRSTYLNAWFKIFVAANIMTSILGCKEILTMCYRKL
jgi:hypothetical protein